MRLTCLWACHLNSDDFDLGQMKIKISDKYQIIWIEIGIKIKAIIETSISLLEISYKLGK